MNDASPNHLIATYIEGWKSGDREKILSTLDPACVVIESYGPIYRGKAMIGRWIDSWFAPGNTVNRWDVTSLYVTEEACFFEWIFECTYAGDRSGFEGASIARLAEGKIVFLREYAMTAPQYEWEG
ncbi:MAG TPA: nuclear transport factor 2 family protein [Ktedonosporobacter sp.]|nr:nuclear transport factor 2 family protein [Ktedonosporobacter sp.]